MIGKLRNRSVAELRDRLVQFGWILTERAGLVADREQRLPVSASPLTPWPDVDASGIRQRLRDDERTVLLRRANRIVDGVFDVLGLQGVSYGNPVNWLRDPIAALTAPRVHWSRVPYLDASIVGDHKVTWEVNRHQWFLTLAQAWVITGDRRYPDRAATLLQEWLDANPAKIGINWCSALELAFRVSSWLHGLRLMGESAALPPQLTRRMLESSVVQMRHVERNLSTWFSPNTHLTGEALTMLSVGCAWPTLPDAARWRNLGWDILCQQLPRQVHDDGVYFEQSAWYQAYTVDFYVMAIAWARQARLAVPPAMIARVRAAALALRTITRPDGTIVRLGDDDGGHTLPLTGGPHGDMTGTLWRAVTLLDDDALVPPVAGGVSALLWLEGTDAFDRAVLRSPHRSSRLVALRTGGLIVFSEPAGAAAADHMLFMDAGPHGAVPYAHSHADALAIDLSVDGVPLFVDAGTGAYVGEPRARFRSTRTHNTVTVDGRDSSEQGASFKWKSAASTRLLGCGTVPGATWASAAHDGYERLADPVRHQRTILRFDRSYWLMFDTLTAAAPHEISVTFQCASGALVNRIDECSFAVSSGAALVSLALDPAFSARVESREVSPAYALELSALAIDASASIAGTRTFCSVFGAEAESGRLRVTATDVESVYHVSHRGGHDLVAAPGGRATTIGPATFDGTALALLGAADPHTVVAAGSGTLHLATQRIELGADEIRVLRRGGDGTWLMER